MIYIIVGWVVCGVIACVLMAREQKYLTIADAIFCIGCGAGSLLALTPLNKIILWRRKS